MAEEVFHYDKEICILFFCEGLIQSRFDIQRSVTIQIFYQLYLIFDISVVKKRKLYENNCSMLFPGTPTSLKRKLPLACLTWRSSIYRSSSCHSSCIQMVKYFYNPQSVLLPKQSSELLNIRLQIGNECKTDCGGTASGHSLHKLYLTQFSNIFKKKIKNTNSSYYSKLLACFSCEPYDVQQGQVPSQGHGLEQSRQSRG